jgi:autotransporter-associated beta strand protein
MNEWIKRSLHMKRRNVSVSIYAWAMVGLLSVSMQANTYTWDGHSPVGNNFSDENWTGAAPTTLNGHDFVFSTLISPFRTTANVDLPDNLNSFTFNASASAMTITGNALQFAASTATPIVNNSTNTQTFRAEVRQFWIGGTNKDRKWNAANGDLSFSNVVLRGDSHIASPLTWTIDGAYNTTISGAISLAGWATGDAALIKTGTGTFRLEKGTFSTTTQISTTGLGVQIAAGTLEVAGGNINVGTNGLGTHSANTGVLNVTAGNVTVAGSLIVGWNSSTTFTISGGALTAGSIRHQDANTGTLTIGGSGVVTAGGVYLAAAGTGADGLTINLNTGGTLVATNLYMTLTGSALTDGTHSLNVNFNGGTLKARATGSLIDPESYSTGSINVTVKAGGAVIDTHGKTVSIHQSLVHDAGLGATPDGGLTKNGAGTLTNTVANTYSGPTTINEGTLSLSQPNPSNDASTITIATGAMLNLTFAGTDTVKKLFVGGQQLGPGLFGAIGSASPIKGISQITGTGTLTVLEGPGTLISFF